jgi:hypothetical protein
MSLSNLDVAIGLLFVFLVISLVCTALNEWFAQIMALRSGTLRNGITQLLEDDLARQFYNHPLISSLRHKGRADQVLNRPGDPSYIPSDLFSAALVDLAAGGGAVDISSVSDVRAAIEKLPEGRARSALTALLDQVADETTDARSVIERWFDDAMDRVSGQYKRRIQIVTIAIAALVTVLVNADAIAITNTLRGDPALRAAIVALAEQTVQQGSFFATPVAGDPPAGGEGTEGDDGTPAANAENGEGVDRERLGRLVDQTEELGLPLGWDDPPDSQPEWLGKVLGLLLTTAAVSLGAPFWFDLLSKVARIRTTGPRPESTVQG